MDGSEQKGTWRTLIGVLLATGTVGCWGVTFVNTKALLAHFSALEIQVLRFLLAYVALWLVHPKWKILPTAEEKTFVLMGFSGVAVYQLLENCAIHFTNASNVAILVSLCPVVTALLVRFFGHGDRLHLVYFIGCAVAMVGVVMVSLNGIRVFHFRPIGDLLAVCAMLSWGFYSMMLSKLVRREHSQLFVARRIFFWALALMVPIVVFGSTAEGRAVLDGSFAVTWTAEVNVRRFAAPINCANLGFLGLCASAGCFVTWNRACEMLGVVRCSAGLYLIPAVTVLFAYAFLGETLTWISAIGAVLITAGVVLSGLNMEKSSFSEKLSEKASEFAYPRGDNKKPR